MAGSIRRMRLSVSADATVIWPAPDWRYNSKAITSGKKLVDNYNLIGELTIVNGLPVLRHDKSAYKPVIKDAQSSRIQLTVGLAPSDEMGDGDTFASWLWAKDLQTQGKNGKSKLDRFADELGRIVTVDIKGISGVNFDIEYVERVPNDGAEDDRRRGALAAFYQAAARAVAPIFVQVIVCAKNSLDLLDAPMSVPGPSATWLHDWRRIMFDQNGQVIANMSLACMAYMYQPDYGNDTPAAKQFRTQNSWYKKPGEKRAYPGQSDKDYDLEIWHRSILRYAVAPPPQGYQEERVLLPPSHFTLIIACRRTANCRGKCAAKFPKPADKAQFDACLSDCLAKSDLAVLETPDPQALRGHLARLFDVGLGVFPHSGSDVWTTVDGPLNSKLKLGYDAPLEKPDPKQAAKNPDTQFKEAPIGSAPPPGTEAGQPYQLPIANPKGEFTS